jgi:hypothetical protein
MIGGQWVVFGGNGLPNGVNLSSIELFNPKTGSWSYRASNAQSLKHPRPRMAFPPEFLKHDQAIAAHRRAVELELWRHPS